MSVSKKDRDAAMKIIINYHKNRKPGHHITPEYLTIHGLPPDVSADEVVEVLQSSNLIKYNSETGIVLTGAGRCYFESEEDENLKIKKQFSHDWKIAVFSAIVGAFLSRPLWSILEWIVALISK